MQTPYADMKWKNIHIPVISNQLMCLLTEQKAEWR